MYPRDVLGFKRFSKEEPLEDDNLLIVMYDSGDLAHPVFALGKYEKGCLTVYGADRYETDCVYTQQGVREEVECSDGDEENYRYDIWFIQCPIEDIS